MMMLLRMLVANSGACAQADAGVDAVVVVVAVDADDTVAGVDDEGDVRDGAVACGVDVCN